eukprot:gene8028-8678_t
MGRERSISGRNRKKHLQKVFHAKKDVGKRVLRPRDISTAVPKSSQLPEVHFIEIHDAEVETLDVNSEEMPIVLKNYRELNAKFFSYLELTGRYSELLNKCTMFLNSGRSGAASALVIPPNQLPLSYPESRDLVITIFNFKKILINLSKEFRGSDHVTTKVFNGIASSFNQQSIKPLKRRFLSFVNNNGFIHNFKRKRHKDITCLINDVDVAKHLTDWMDKATKATPPAHAKDFAAFIQIEYETKISLRTAQLWLHRLGFRYRPNNMLELYHDGHERADVKKALIEYIALMERILPLTTVYHGDDMNASIKPNLNNDQQEHILNFHDESCVHSKETCSRCWRRQRSGKIKNKSKGDPFMISAYISNEDGFHCARTIEPGAAANKDDYWTSKDLLKQAEEHLLSFTSNHPNTCTVDIYDNSSGHSCKAADALEHKKLNLSVGHARKEEPRIRIGWYLLNDQRKQQSMRFLVGDILLVPVSKGSDLNQTRKASIDYAPNTRIDSVQHELFGVVKGCKQVLLERKVPFSEIACARNQAKRKIEDHQKAVQEEFANNRSKDDDKIFLAFLSLKSAEEVEDFLDSIGCDCPRCKLSQQPDFNEIQSALEDLYKNFNEENNTNHICLFLPKFHPELNPIERVWQVIKRHIKKFNDEGNLPKVRELYKESITESVLQRALIRKFIRLMYVYLYAYDQGLDVIQAESFRRERKSHRSHSPSIDTTLEQRVQHLYHPVDNTEEEGLLGMFVGDNEADEAQESPEEVDLFEEEEEEEEGHIASIDDEDLVQETILDEINNKLLQ